MDFSKSTPFCLLSLTLLLHGIVAVDPLFHFCSKSGNYIANGPFDKNLYMLAGYFSSKVAPTGFGIGSVGGEEDRANGIAFCRGDVSGTDCKTCVVQAGREIRKRCPEKKAGIVWYDNCLFKYSDEDFFGKIDKQNKFYMYNLNNVSDPLTFNQKTKDLITRLSEEAYLTPMLFATGEMELEESKKLYGLVQCTRDLSSDECKKCLYGAIAELPSCCDGRRGGRVVGGSCNFRYEIYPFVNVH